MERKKCFPAVSLTTGNFYSGSPGLSSLISAYEEEGVVPETVFKDWLITVWGWLMMQEGMHQADDWNEKKSCFDMFSSPSWSIDQITKFILNKFIEL